MERNNVSHARIRELDQGYRNRFMLTRTTRLITPSSLYVVQAKTTMENACRITELSIARLL
jgi:hypothetical protein